MRIFILCLVAGVLTACNPAPQAAGKPKQGRDETQGIRNTEAIGYAGNAIANKVDSALNANDQRTGELNKELEKQEGGN